MFEARADELGAPLSRYGEEWLVARRAEGSRSSPTGGRAQLPPPRLLGAHQIRQCRHRARRLPFLEGFSIDGDAQMRGLREVEWPARLQRLTRGPLARSLPPGWELWLDGGHNESPAQALADIRGCADDEGRRATRPLHLIFGMLYTKDPVAFLKPLAPLTRISRRSPSPATPLSPPRKRQPRPRPSASRPRRRPASMRPWRASWPRAASPPAS